MAYIPRYGYKSTLNKDMIGNALDDDLEAWRKKILGQAAAPAPATPSDEIIKLQNELIKGAASVETKRPLSSSVESVPRGVRSSGTVNRGPAPKRPSAVPDLATLAANRAMVEHEAVDALRPGAMGWPEALGRSAVSGVASIPESIANLGRIGAKEGGLISGQVVRIGEKSFFPGLRVASMVAKPLQRLYGAEERLAQSVAEPLTAARQKLMAPVTQKGTPAQRFISPVVGEAVPMIATGLAGKAIAGAELAANAPKAALWAQRLGRMVPFGAKAFADYTTEEEKKGTPFPKALAVGGAKALAETATEIPAYEVFFGKAKKLIPKSLLEAGAKNLLAKAGGKILGMAGGAALEGGQEGIVDPILNLIDKVATEPGKPWTGPGGVIDPSQMAQSTFGGGLLGGIMSAMGLPFNMKSRQMAEKMVEGDKAPTPLAVKALEVQVEKDMASMEQQNAPAAVESAGASTVPDRRASQQPYTGPDRRKTLDDVKAAIQAGGGKITPEQIQRMVDEVMPKPAVKPSELEGKPLEPVKVKEPWEMTALEYTQSRVPGAVSVSGNIKAQHRVEVKAAIERGDPVPSEVLAEYPDLEGKPAVSKSPADAIREILAGEKKEEATVSGPAQKEKDEKADPDAAERIRQYEAEIARLEVIANRLIPGNLTRNKDNSALRVAGEGARAAERIDTLRKIIADLQAGKTPSEGLVDPALLRERDQLKTELARIEAATAYANENDMPGTFVTGASGIDAARRRKLDEQLDRTIDRAKDHVATKKALEDVESKIRAQQKAPWREAVRSTVEARMEKQFATIEVGDLIDVGGNMPLKVVKKNAKTVVTGSGVKYTAQEIARVIKSSEPAQKTGSEDTATPPRPLVNPHASALKQDEQLRKQQAWDKKYGKALKPLVMPLEKKPAASTAREEVDTAYREWQDAAAAVKASKADLERPDSTRKKYGRQAKKGTAEFFDAELLRLQHAEQVALKKYLETRMRHGGKHAPAGISIHDEGFLREAESIKAKPDRTGLTKGQKAYLADHLIGAAEELESSSAEKAVIKVPGDGTFAVSSPAQANALHKKLTGENIGEMAPEKTPETMKPKVGFDGTIYYWYNQETKEFVPANGAKAVSFPELSEHQFFVSQNEGDPWVVSEARTGSFIASGKDQNDAIKNARELFAQIGKEKFDESIEKTIKDTGVSPRYAGEKPTKGPVPSLKPAQPEPGPVGVFITERDAYRRTTPKRGTPEREGLDADYKTYNEEFDRLSDVMAKAKQARDKTKPYSPQYEAADKKLTQAQKAFGDFRDSSDATRKTHVKAYHEDLVETAKNPFVVLNALEKLGVKLDPSAFVRMKETAGQEALRRGLSKEDAEAVSLEAAGFTAFKPGESFDEAMTAIIDITRGRQREAQIPGIVGEMKDLSFSEQRRLENTLKGVYHDKAKWDTAITEARAQNKQAATAREKAKADAEAVATKQRQALAREVLDMDGIGYLRWRLAQDVPITARARFNTRKEAVNLLQQDISGRATDYEVVKEGKNWAVTMKREAAVKWARKQLPAEKPVSVSPELESAGKPLESKRALEDLKPLKVRGGTGNAMAAQASAVFNTQQQERKPPAKPSATGDAKRAINDAAINAIKAADDIHKTLSPATRGEQAKQAGGIIREKAAELARKTERAHEALKKLKKEMDRLLHEEALEFMDNIEHDRPQKTPALTQAAKMFRKMLDTARDEVQALGLGKLEHYIEDYFPHVWKDPNKARDVFARVFGKRPLAGPASFLKQRKIPTIKEGIEKGMEPVSYNPVDLVLLKLREMHRYVMGQKILAEMKEKGLVRYVYAQSKTPDGYVVINDRIATVYGPPAIEVKEAYDERLMRELMAFAESLGVDVQRKVKIGGRGRWGYAKGGSEVVTKFGGPETVLSHEIGHILDTRYGLSELLKAEPETRKELQALADLRYEGKDATPGFKQYVRKMTEKTANLVHAYIHAPELLRKTAPLSEDILNGLIRARQELEPLSEIKPSLVLGENKAQMPVAGLRIMGRYAAPEPVARVLNNYLSPGLRGKPIYDGARWLGNIMNQVQLGMSAFHAGVTTMDSIVSKVSLAAEQFSQGEAGKGAVSLGKALVPGYAPIENLVRGSKLLEAYFKDSPQGQATAQIIDAVVAGGGRVKMDSFYHNSAVEKFWQALGATKEAAREGKPGAALLRGTGAAMRSPAAMIEVMAKPIMEWLVPRMKLGVFADIMANEFDRLGPDATHEQVRQAAMKAWDSVDNRMGQMVYDNLFWNKTLKDVGFLCVRSLGWNLGTFRELGGGVIDVPAQFVRAVKGDLKGKPFMTHRMAYVIGLTGVTALYGAILTYLLTGEGPKELKDYIFIKTGHKKPDGTEQRVSLPQYAKDIYAYSKHPITTLGHKIHPFFSMLVDIWRNEDYYGTKIRNEDDPAVQQVKDAFAYAAKQFMPFSVRNIMERAEEGPAAMIQSFVGLTPAPASVSKSKAQEMMAGFVRAKMPQGSRTKEEAETSQYVYQLRDKMRQSKGSAKVRMEVIKAAKEGRITLGQQSDILKNWSVDPRVPSFKRLTAEEAVKVYEAGTAEEKKLWRLFLVVKINNRIANLGAYSAERKKLQDYLKSIK